MLNKSFKDKAKAQRMFRRWKRDGRRVREKGYRECSICQEDMSKDNEEILPFVLACDHIFHVKCYKMHCVHKMLEANSESEFLFVKNNGAPCPNCRCVAPASTWTSIYG